MNGMFKNSFTLCRFILRRDRLRILLWFIGIIFGFIAALREFFGNEEGISAMIGMMENPAMVAMIGPVYYDFAGRLTIGAMYALFMTVWTAVIMAVMNIFHVVRHTRQDEERGRIEVIRSLPTGRLSPLSAAMISAVVINAAFALLLGFSLSILGSEGMGLKSSLLFGGLMGATGIVFAAATAVLCQITANPHTALSASFAYLIIAFLIRAAGDVQKNELLACISPLGIISRSKVYIDNLLWPLLVLLLTAIIFTISALWLCSIRDMGEGIVPARAGRRNAKNYLKSPGGLAWRLLKTPFAIWAITIPVLSMSYGSVMGDIDDFIKSSPMLIQLTDGNPLRMVGFIVVIMSMCAAIPVLQFILRARSEEKRGYAENIIARSASRHNQLFGYFITALISSFLMPFLNCLGFWLGGAAVMKEPFKFTEILSACMIYTPALLFMLGIAMMLIAYLPAFTSFAYAYLGYSFACIYLGALIGLPGWLGKLSPFGHIPMLPLPVGFEIQTAQIAAIIILTALSAAMIFLGFIGYRERDMKFSA